MLLYNHNQWATQILKSHIHRHPDILTTKNATREGKAKSEPLVACHGNWEALPRAETKSCESTTKSGDEHLGTGKLHGNPGALSTTKLANWVMTELVAAKVGRSELPLR